MKDLCLQFAVLAALYSLQFFLGHQADLDGCQHSLSVKELDKKVHRQLATSGGSAIEAMVPSLNVVVGANGMFEYCPVCWAPSGSVNPRAGYILSELQERLGSFPLKYLEHWLYFRFWEKGQGHHLSDKVVRPTVIVVCGLKGEVLHLLSKEERKREYISFKYLKVQYWPL